MQGVLVVDDHAPFRAVARQLLEAGEFELVGEAKDGAGAIAAIEARRPDVVLLDFRLPDMSGIDVAREVLSKAFAPAVVLISTADPGDYQEIAIRVGARGFIAKGELSAARLRAVLGNETS